MDDTITLRCCGGKDRHLAGCKHYGSDRGTGKTTRLMETAVDLIAEGYEVYVTGAHRPWMHQLEHEFKAAGLIGVRFVTIEQIGRGALRGAGRARLLVDDEHDLPLRDREFIRHERRIMESRG